jgi:nitrite reductase/ring-hydroxylating ferredoxin subunit
LVCPERLVCGASPLIRHAGRPHITSVLVQNHGNDLSHSGEVFATQAECPHLEGPLADGLTGGATVVCPLHERAYDLRTGLGLNGECTSLRIYPASLGGDGKIWVTVPA